MGFDAFLTLAKHLDVITKELTRAELQLIFVRANINRVDDDDSNDKPDALLELAEFVGAVTRMAYERLPHLVTKGGLAAQMDEFVNSYLEPQIDRVMCDEVGQLLDDRQVQLVLYKHRAWHSHGQHMPI